MEYKGYTARVEFDDAAGVMFGEVEGLRDVVTFEATDVKQLERAFRDSVDDYLELCAKQEREPEKPYSGKFLVRVDPKLHRDIAMAAARAGKSLNAFVGEAVRQWIMPTAQAPVVRGPAAAPYNAIDARAEGGAAPPLKAFRLIEDKAVVVDAGPPGRMTMRVNTPGKTQPASNTTPPASRTPQWVAQN